MLYDFIPDQLTDEWVRDHVRPVFVDDEEALLALSKRGDEPATQSARLAKYRQISDVVYGYELRVQVTKVATPYIRTEALWQASR